MGPSTRNLHLTFSDKSQSIIIGADLLSNPSLLAQYVEGPQVFIVTNETIAPYYLKKLQDAFIDKQCDCILLPDGEAYKNQQSLFAIYAKLIDKCHHRDTTLIALGGGVIGDLTGFAAATYQRGVSFLQIPTTLLAQVDAAVGGKTAINHQKAKNVIGSFYQAKAVLMDLTTLNTLPAREFRSGVAEIIKCALLVGGDLLSIVKTFLPMDLPFKHDASEMLSNIIYQCCEVKSQFVIEDENETKGKRFFLNLGHTVGHALEACTDYRRWLHGEAVAIGLYCMALVSAKYAGLDVKNVAFLESLLRMAKLPVRIPADIDLRDLMRFIKHDKKIRKKQLTMVLMRAPGDCYIETQLPEDDLFAVLQTAVEYDEV